MPVAAPDPSLFKVEILVPVRWGDMDALGHVNNARYFGFFEEVRFAYLQRVAPGEKLTPESPAGPILARTHCDFIEPVEYPATLSVACRTTRVGTSSLEVEHLVRDRETGRVHAVGTAVLVIYDYQRRCKVPVPAAMRERIRALDGV